MGGRVFALATAPAQQTLADLDVKKHRVTLLVFTGHVEQTPVGTQHVTALEAGQETAVMKLYVLRHVRMEERARSQDSVPALLTGQELAAMNPYVTLGVCRGCVELILMGTMCVSVQEAGREKDAMKPFAFQSAKMTESALSLEYVPALLIGEDLAVKNLCVFLNVKMVAIALL